MTRRIHRSSLSGVVRRLFRVGPAVLFTLVLSLSLAVASRAVESPRSAMSGLAATDLRPIIRLTDQPFYPDLERVAFYWDDSQIGHVEDRTPTETLLNFYAVMAKVGLEIEAIRSDARTDPGLGWSPSMQERIDDVNDLFNLAIKALNGSGYPESVRRDLVDESAIELKMVLDYVFSHSRRPIELPDQAAIQALANGVIQKDVLAWRLPGTGIVLASNAEMEGNDWYFSPSTVLQSADFFSDIEGEAERLQGVPFATPDFYRNFIRTPGHLVPPKWYLRLPLWLHDWIEVDLIAGQTLFQILMAFVVIASYLVVVIRLLSLLMTSHLNQDNQLDHSLNKVEDDALWAGNSVAWRRVLYVFPILPLTRLAKLFVDDFIHFTGSPLVISIYFFYVAWCLSACLLAFYFFESFGQSATQAFLRVRGLMAPSRLQRWRSRVQPISRALSGIVALLLVYQMLIQLGLPGSLVLALSSVPGLAIALGASKLLSNLFAGFSIQTDRPLRVGEFCRIGDYLGFVTKIGLRSIELKTLTSTVAIPNSIADDSIIVNFSDRARHAVSDHRQGVEIRMPLDRAMSSGQINQLIFFLNRHLESVEGLVGTHVDLEQTSGDVITIVGFGYGDFSCWDDYLAMRKALFVRFKQIIAQVLMSRVVFRVAFQTSDQVRRRIPEDIQSIVSRDQEIVFGSCELLQVADYSYEYYFDFRAFHATYAAFLKAVDRINQDLLVYAEQANIIIPVPTSKSIFIQKPAEFNDASAVNPLCP